MFLLDTIFKVHTKDDYLLLRTNHGSTCVAGTELRRIEHAKKNPTFAVKRHLLRSKQSIPVAELLDFGRNTQNKNINHFSNSHTV